MSSNNQQSANISPELDRMTCAIMDEFLCALAEGEVPGVVACIEDDQSHRAAVAFSEDGDEVCLQAADVFVADAAESGSPEDGVGKAVRYAIVYLGCVQGMDGAYNDAMITVFGERGLESAYSAFTLVKGLGQGENFMWSDPEPAGEEPLLV
ncbi:MAG: hypothetical protein SOU51_02365 [Collinsella sp.]|nr:hypothetical protein [Collinsella sp.]